jgi:Rad3-related DNA helicase
MSSNFTRNNIKENELFLRFKEINFNNELFDDTDRLFLLNFLQIQSNFRQEKNNEKLLPNKFHYPNDDWKKHLIEYLPNIIMENSFKGFIFFYS